MFPGISARLGLFLVAAAMMAMVPVCAARKTPSVVKTKDASGGCVMAGKHYPEGAIYPPQTPGAMRLTVALHVCRNGKWVLSAR
jgi:hypothetical protein